MDVQERRVAKSLIDYWQLWVLLLGGAIACVKFYYTVQDVSEAQRKWQEGSEVRRERTHDALDALDNRIIRLEKDVEWLKKERQ